MMLGSILLALPANARIETLRWTHVDVPNVAGFIVYYGLSSGDYTTIINVPSLQPDAQGVFTFNIDVPEVTIYVSVTAYNSDEQESEYSNELIRRAVGKPGTPYVFPL